MITKKKKKVKKRTYRIVDFAIPEKNSENLRKQKERQVFRPCQRTKTVIPIVIGARGGFERGLKQSVIRGRIETI